MPESIQNAYERFANCAINVLTIPGQNIYSSDVADRVRERVGTDAYLIAEGDGHKRDSLFYRNVAVQNLVHSLFKTLSQHRALGISRGMFEFFENFRPCQNLTENLTPWEGDVGLALAIIDQSERVFTQK